MRIEFTDSDSGYMTCPSCSGYGELEINDKFLGRAVCFNVRKITCPACKGSGRVFIEYCKETTQ